VASLLNTAYGYLVLPESLPVEKRAAFSWRRANPVGALGLLRSNLQLLRLSAAMFLYNLAHAVFPAVFVLHAGYRFGWGEGMVGLALAGFGACSAIVQGALVKPVVGRIGERKALALGFSGGIVGLLIYASAQTGLGFWLATPIMAIWGFIGPSAQGIMSQLVTPSQQGQLQGAGSSLMAVASLIGPTLFTTAFALGIDSERGAPLPGAPYFVAAALMAASLAVAWWATRPHTQT
jgi:MFS transporter, DHA1 family, tetracycline resistance protein